MEAAMVSAFSGAMGSLLSKLAGLLEKDFKLARGVKEDIVTLRDEMSTINASLMELSQMEEPIDDVHRELRAKVRELAYDMEDCVDISMHCLGDPSKAGFLRELKSLRARCEIAKLISALKARVAQLGNRHKLILQLPERPRAVRVDPRIQALYQDPASLQGIGGQREKVVELLHDGAPHLKVVSILGTGGIGKTTLAKHVYTAIQDKFDCTAFVSVSRIPDPAKILSDIIQQSGWYSRSQDDVTKLICDLRQRLENKRIKLARWSPPPRLLRRLHVLECQFSTIPADWITQLHNLSSLEIEVRSLPSDGVDILARLTMLVHLKLHVLERVPQEGFVVFHRAAFPNLRELLFRWEAPCLVLEAGTMPRLRSLFIDCYTPGPRQTDGVLDGIEHLGSLVELKLHLYWRQGYISRFACCADGKRQRVEEQRRWDGRSLEAALKEAISKHPGILRVVIEDM